MDRVPAAAAAAAAPEVNPDVQQPEQNAARKRQASPPSPETSHQTKKVRFGNNNMKKILRKSSPHFANRVFEQEKLKNALKAEQYFNPINVAITGAPGIGKTELVLKVVESEAENFDHVFWIRSDSEEKILEDFKNIIQVLNLPIDTTSDIEIILHRLYAICNNHKCLFIYDNVTDYSNFVAKYLSSYSIDKSKLCFIVTSFYKDWNCDVRIHLKPFSVAEAKTFLKNQLNLPEQQFTGIINLLGTIPLLLQLSVSFIKHQNELKFLDNKQYSIKSFLFDIKIAKIKFIEYKLETNEKLGYSSSLSEIFTNLFRILKLSHDGEKATEILRQLSYIDSKQIPPSLFHSEKKTNSGNNLEINASILLLEKFSLISCVDKRLTIAPSSQFTMVMMYKTSGQKFISQLMGSIIRKAISQEENPHIIHYALYLPHILKIWEHARQYSTLVKCHPQFPLLIMHNENIGYEDCIRFFNENNSLIVKQCNWSNEYYIIFQHVYILSNFKLKHHQKVLAQCEIVEQNISLDLKNTTPALGILHHKASSLSKVGKLDEAYVLAKDVLERKLPTSSIDSILDTLKRMCAIVTKAYQLGRNLLMISPWKLIAESILFANRNNLSEKAEFLGKINKYFVRMEKIEDLIDMFDKMDNLLRKALGELHNETLINLLRKSLFLCEMDEMDASWNICVKLMGILDVEVLPSRPVLQDDLRNIITALKAPIMARGQVPVEDAVADDSDAESVDD